MIPKIIHFCWLSSDEYPVLIKNCIRSWKEKLPEYEFILWDTKKIDLETNLWSKQAFAAKKYAFAADYIRLYAVYNYGGIYLDTDIEVFKSFNDLLELPYFIGSEGDATIEAGVFGAEPKSEWIGKCLSFYNNRNFIKEDGSFNIITLPRVMMAQIEKDRTIQELNQQEVVNINSLITDNKTLFLFPYDYFCAKNHGTGIIEKTNNTYSVHHFAMSWLPRKTRTLTNFKNKLIKIFGVNTVSKFINFFWLKELFKNK